MSSDYSIRRASELMKRRIDEDLVALDVDQGACYGFKCDVRTRLGSDRSPPTIVRN